MEIFLNRYKVFFSVRTKTCMRINARDLFSFQWKEFSRITLFWHKILFVPGASVKKKIYTFLKNNVQLLDRQYYMYTYLRVYLRYLWIIIIVIVIIIILYFAFKVQQILQSCSSIHNLPGNYQ